MRPCFAFTPAAAASEEATLSIYDEIGFWGVQASDFRTALAAVKAKVLNVEINSPGGDVFAGLAIYNMLRASGKEIVVKVMGVAASAASLIAMAGDKIVMPKNTFMMVHNPWSFAMGNADELRETADTLDKIGVSLLNTYVNRTGKTEDEIKPLLAKDTWLTADEALEMGFADEVVDDIKANAKFDMARADLPEQVKALFKAGPDEEDVDPDNPDGDPAAKPPAVEGALATQIQKAAIAAGIAEDDAAFLAVACETEEQGTQRIAAAREIAALCALAKQPKMASKLVRDGKSVKDARAAIMTALAEADKDVDTTGSAQQNEQRLNQTRNAGPRAVNTKAIWDRRNQQQTTK